MLGLLADDRDLGHHAIIARFGNISAFAHDQRPMEQGNGRLRPCHLGDMRSRSGFSGSPVIGYRQVKDMAGNPHEEMYLLGIHSAQHPERIRSSTPDQERSFDVPSSLTRIVPGWILVDLIKEHDVFSARRSALMGEVRRGERKIWH
jgi:hypothetical protein